MKKETRELINRMAEAVEGERNRYNRSFWKNQPYYGRSYYRGVPLKRPDGSVPFVVELDISLWAELLGFTVGDFYADPEEYLAGQIKMNLHKLEVFKDNTLFTGEITPYPGIVYELSFFGIETIYPRDRNPWINPEPIIKEYEDLDKIPPPDFFTSGLMPRVHEFYERFGAMAGDKLHIEFPDWFYSPFGIATHLRGLTNLLVDMLINPEWVHKLMSFITESHRSWSEARAKFLGREVGKGKLFNDEVDCPVISPDNYRELILPYELEWERFHKGLIYFHSCGNLSKLLPDIRTLRSLEMLHVGPWTDMDAALALFGGDTVFDVCLDPIDDVLRASDERMEEKLKSIVSKLSGKAGFSIRADAFQKMGDTYKDDYRKILKWCDIARKICGQA